jgi:peptide-methionine (S)-S-oxide reductase
MSLFAIFSRSILFLATFTMAMACNVVNSSSKMPETSAPISPTPVRSAPGPTQTAVFAGGCFWGVEAVFEHVKGVTDVVSGYSGGDAITADYEAVSGGKTSHAEAVKVTFDPSAVTYEQLMKVFFTVAHDPTQLNFQGPDHGPQYRSAIFFENDEQKSQAMAFIASLAASKAFSEPIVTELAALAAFYPAEAYHQDYMKMNPNDPYIVYHDIPKVEALKQKFPELYSAK